MRHFLRLASGMDVSGLALLLAQKPTLWNKHRLRKDYPGSPHKMVDDIWLRWNEVTQGDEPKVINDLETINYPAWGELPQARQIVLNLARVVEADRIGRVMVTRLPPGEVIHKHQDQGGYANYYKRYHIMIQSGPGCVFWCGLEQVQMLTGEAWWFDANLPHEVVNNSADDRISLIVDLHPL